jgi:hypothetical protein
MSEAAEIDRLILEHIKSLPERDKREILNFIEYLKVKEDQNFIEYVNKRTRAAMAARQRGERFTSLEELQREYA